MFQLKPLSFSFAVIATLGLSACGNNQTQTPAQGTDSNANTQSSAAPEASAPL